MNSRILSAFTALCLTLATSCGSLQAISPLMTVARSGGSFVPPQLRKISPIYQGPLSITIDPAIAAKHGGFKTHSTRGGFRITARSSGGTDDHDRGLGNSGGSDADNPGHGNDGSNNGNHFGQQRRHDAWMIEHGSYSSHGSDDQGTYFDPSTVGSLAGLQIDPTVGEMPVGEQSIGTSGLAVSSQPATPVDVVSGKIAVLPQSNSALQEVLSLVGGRTIGTIGDGFVVIAPDLSRADLSRLPDYLRAFSQFLDQPITSAEFSSVNTTRTFTLQLMLMTEHQDLVSAVAMDTIPSSMLTTGPNPHIDTEERPGPVGVGLSEIKHLINHKVREAWTFGLGFGSNRPVRVAYLDRGFKPDHCELARCLVPGLGKSYFFSGLFPSDNPFGPAPFEDPVPDGPAWHGTYSAIVGFGDINNAAGAMGIAPRAELIPISVFSSFDKASAINYALDNGADVIGSSIGLNLGSHLLALLYSAPMFQAVQRATQANVPLVFAAGNENDDAIHTYGGALSEPIIVGAAVPPGTTDQAHVQKGGQLSPTDWVRAAYSNWGERVDVWASSSVTVDSKDDTVGQTPVNPRHVYSGTSCATPQVCAVVALMKAAAFRAGFGESLTVAQIRQILRSSSNRPSLNKKLILQSSGQVAFQSIDAPILDAYDAVVRTIQMAPDQSKRDVTRYAIQAVTGIMTNVQVGGATSTYPQGRYEVADFIAAGNPNAIASGLRSVGLGAYTRQKNQYAQVSPSGATYTLIDGEGWPLVGNASDPARFEVYAVNAQPTPSLSIASISPTTVDRDQPTNIVVTGQFLLQPLRLTIGNTTLTANSVNDDFTQAQFTTSGTVLDLGTFAPAITNGLGMSVSSSQQVTVNSSTSNNGTATWKARIYRADDTSRIEVNYIEINGSPRYGCYYTAGPGQDVYLDISNQIYRGNNNITLKTTNNSGSSSWGFEVREYSSEYPGGYKVHLNEVSPPGRTDTSTGTVFFKTYSFFNESSMNPDPQLGPTCSVIAGW